MSYVLEVDISDHLPSLLCTNIKTNDLDAPKMIKCRIFDLKANTAIKCAIKNSDWSFIENTELNLDQASKLFSKKLTDIIDTYAPEKSRKIDRLEQGYPSWITSALIVSMNKRNKLFEKYKNNRDSPKLKEYITYHNKINSPKRISKR